MGGSNPPSAAILNFINNQNKMKNVHIIPTDKPSRLHLGNSGLVLCDLNYSSNTINSQHIYITSDEEIKMDDWYLDDTNSVRQAITECESYWTHRKKYQKIILTDNKDLIKDGVVQAIDDAFIEWFVKNQSCEEVEIQCRYNFYVGQDLTHYKIIIPKEEPKQHLIDMMKRDEELGLYEEPKQEKFEHIPYKGNVWEPPLQETLEEAAEINCESITHPYCDREKAMFIKGAKWQQEQILQFLYSEITERRPYSSSRMCEDVIKFIEQFKKK